MITSNVRAMASDNPVAEILEALMSKHRLSQTELANRSGVSQPAINRILKERAKQPRKETLQNQLMGQEPISARMIATGAVPIVSWESLGQEGTHSRHSEWLVCPIDHSNETFALPVLGDAMVGDDGYREGEIIFIDPCVTPVHGKDVVVLKGEMAFFRRLVVTPEGRFLKTLNSSWPTPIMLLTDDAIVCGTVVFSGRVR